MNNLGDILGSLQEGLPKVLGFAMLMLVLTSDLLFAMLQVYPAVRTHTELASQLADARQTLDAPAGDGQVEAKLKAKLAKMQATLDIQTNTFLPESDVSVVLNQLYANAYDTGVQIAKVQAANAAGPASKAASRDVQSFQVQVSGPTLQLIEFVARLKEASQPAVVINQLAIATGKGPQDTSTLTMNLVLYTAPAPVQTIPSTQKP